MDKLKELMSLCKCGVHITVNEHRDYYDTAAQKLENAASNDSPPEIEDSVRAKMIETDTIVVIHFYPDTPVGYFEIWHHDIEAALDEALECFAERRNDGIDD